MTDKAEIEIAEPRGLSQAETMWRLMERQAAGLAKAQGGIVPEHFKNKPGDILAAFMMAQTYNIDPFACMRGLYFVRGKPSMTGDLLLAIAYANGAKVVETGGEYPEDHPKDGKLFASCSVWRAGTPTTDKPDVTIIFDQVMAERAGLWGSSDPWRKYPERMLRMRARGMALRDAIPEYLAGAYIEGEIPATEPKDITPDE